MLIEHGWIQHVWQSIEKYNIKLKGPYITPSINRINDYALMEKVIQDDLYTDEDVKSINRCRLYLRVQNLSEIKNGQGDFISYCARNHIKDPDRISKYNWPYQPLPKKHDWDIWNDALQNVWSDGNYKVKQSLEAWYKTRSFSSNWQHSQSTQLLYYRVSTHTYNAYEKRCTNRRYINQYRMKNYSKTSKRHRFRNCQ